MSRTKKMQAVLFGPQGCGKGTQGQLLADRFDVPLVGAGDLFRAEAAKETALGKLAKQYIESGNLAPDELVNGIMSRQLKRLELTRGWILDGFPRNVEQAKHLHRTLTPNVAIFIRISERIAIKRLLSRRQCMKCRTVWSLTAPPPSVHPGRCSVCGGKLARRSDDKEDAIQARLSAYRFMTEPLSRF